MKDQKLSQRLNVLFIDNFDSFVFNLVDEFEKRDCNVSVWRNDIGAEHAMEIVDGFEGPSLIVLSPGPGAPEEAGCCIDLIRLAAGKVPIFGVCLGHQSIVTAFDGVVNGADTIVHGKSSTIQVAPQSVLFNGMTAPVSVGRYHSLVGRLKNDDLKVTATYEDMVMAVEHRTKPVLGVQFHPESILTPVGGQMIENVMAWAVANEIARDVVAGKGAK